MNRISYYYEEPYPIRILEFVLCVACLAIAVHILLHVHKSHIILKAILILVSGSYVYITTVDIISKCLLKPIAWTSWALFAVMGALSFFLCTGLLILLNYLTLALYVLSIITNGFTGIVFLLELLTILSWLLQTRAASRKRKHSTSISKTTSDVLSPKISKTADIGPSDVLSIKISKTGPSMLSTNKSSQFPDDDFQLSDKAVQCPCKALLKKGKFTYTNDSSAKRLSTSKIITHGGTFHVSKDIAPVLTTSHESPESVSRGDSPLSKSPRSSVETREDSQKPGNRCKCKIAERVGLRTVATSARTVPKQSQDNTSECQPEKDDTKEQQAMFVHDRAITPGHIYTCSYCGCSSHQFSTLPTVAENVSCDLRDSALRKEQACYACSYVKELINTNKAYSWSREDVETDRPPLLNTCSQQTSFAYQEPNRQCCDCFLQTDDTKPLAYGASRSQIQSCSYLKGNLWLECAREKPTGCTEKETVLPGTVDRTPPQTTIKVEQLSSSCEHKHVPYVVNYDEKVSDLNEAFLVPLSTPHTIQRENVQPERRTKKNCSIM